MLLLLQFRTTDMKKHPYQRNTKVSNTHLSDKPKDDSKSIYRGGAAKSLVRLLAPSQQSHVIPNYTSLNPTLFEWEKFDNFFLKLLNQKSESRLDFGPWFSMKPRKTGILQSLENSEWYQKLASHCVDWSPDSYSWDGFLCSGVTDFGINLFIEAIAFKDLVVCAIIGYATGDSLFCLSLYLTRFLFQDYFPDVLKEEYHYTDGRLRSTI